MGVLVRPPLDEAIPCLCRRLGLRIHPGKKRAIPRQNRGARCRGKSAVGKNNDD